MVTYMFYKHFTECSCFWIPNTQQYLANCSNAELTYVPDNIPSNTTHLLLHNNTLNQLRNNSFKRLVKLQWLDVSNCQIYKMEARAFLGLQNLQVLSLKDNHLNEKNNSYAPSVFSTLAEKLTFLDISKNLDGRSNMSYPGEALSVLNSLKTLRLDCISGLKLDRGFENLTNLTELDFSGGIPAKYLPDDMFSSISNLKIKTINFTNVNVEWISEKVFSSLRSLRVLDFTNNPQARDALVSVSLTLNQTSIEELYLENTSLGKFRTVNHVLQNLNGASIKILSLDRNNIHRLDFSLIIFGLPLLETFTVTHNGLYEFIFMFENFINATNLKKVDISYQHFLLDSSSQNLPTSQKIESFPRANVPEFCGYGSVCVISQWLKTLEWLAASHVGPFKIPTFPQVNFLANGSLKYADVSGNLFKTFPEPFKCPNKLHKLLTIDHVDVSNCGIQCLVKDMFEHCQYHIRFANLSHNELGLLEGGCNNKDPMDMWLSIRPLTTIEILDLSYNSIAALLNDTFDTLINLRKLFLSNNRLSSWKPNLIKLVHLQYLDLSYNKFQTLPLDKRLMLHKLDKDHWQKTSKHLTLNLDGNKFSCTCKNIQFLKWVAASKIYFIYQKQFTCKFIEGREVFLINNLNQIIIELESKCTSNIWFIRSLAGLAIHIFLVTMTTVLFRFRHFLKYLILKMRMRRERLDAV